MKTILISLLFVLLSAFTVMATDVVLQWDPNSEVDLAGYYVYEQVDGPSIPFNKVQTILKGTTTATIKSIDVTKEHYYAVTAYNTAGLESAYSNIVSLPSAPKAPLGLKWVITISLEN